ncbi:hypothetical protein [Methylobacterium sp. 37f]|uniref:DUF6894 family protein n=1 Tax=Methylobacterium sp. 37f TaxID=2817058 RepID=UPI001FFD10BA|nr:hypothetical protein [Methylobacterium sp. 37f]MCK2056850.1 hypothetical protein [Methylobacterium sp. 37f]
MLFLTNGSILSKAGLMKLYFDFDDGRTQFRDEEGIDLPNVEAAQTEVLKTLAEIAKDALPKSDQQAFNASVRNTSGNIVYSVEVTVSGEWHEPSLL